jgi:hypothetical protein
MPPRFRLSRPSGGLPACLPPGHVRLLQGCQADGRWAETGAATDRRQARWCHGQSSATPLSRSHGQPGSLPRCAVGVHPQLRAGAVGVLHPLQLGHGGADGSVQATEIGVQRVPPGSLARLQARERLGWRCHARSPTSGRQGLRGCASRCCQGGGLGLTPSPLVLGSAPPGCRGTGFFHSADTQAACRSVCGEGFALLLGGRGCCSEPIGQAVQRLLVDPRQEGGARWRAWSWGAALLSGIHRAIARARLCPEMGPRPSVARSGRSQS